MYETTQRQEIFLPITGNPTLHRIVGCWNAGDTLQEACRHLAHHNLKEADIKPYWDKLLAQWGDAPVGFKPRKVTGSSEYLLWKGEIGPGKLLRDILSDKLSKSRRIREIVTCNKGGQT